MIIRCRESFPLPRFHAPAALWLALLAGQPAALLAQTSSGTAGSSSGAAVYSNDPSMYRLQSQLRYEYISKRIEREYLDQLQAGGEDETGRAADLPPVLPALGESLPVGTASGHPPEYRDQLVDQAGASYFMAYTSLLRQNAVSTARTRRLAAQAGTWKKLLEELHGSLARAATGPAGDQAAQLAGFARAQARPLAALETEEEAIRLDFTTRAAFREYEDGVRLPVAHAGAQNLPPAAIVLLFAGQFDAGLSATQRELLQGLVQDLSAPDGTAFSFWPARARLPLRADLPADLVAQLQRVQQLKQQLVLETMGVLDQTRDAKYRATRAPALAELGVKQASDLATLNALADELRPRLAEIYRPVPPPPTDAPPDLLRQVARTYARKAALQRDVTAELAELRRLRPHDKFVLTQSGTDLAIVFMAGALAEQAPKLAALENKNLQERLKTANRELARLTQILNQDSQSLQNSLREYRDKSPPSPAKDLSQLAVSLGQAQAAQENDRLYRDYRTAVFQPGLSLEQRRLLLRGVLADVERARLQDPWAEERASRRD